MVFLHLNTCASCLLYKQSKIPATDKYITPEKQALENTEAKVANSVDDCRNENNVQLGEQQVTCMARNNLAKSVGPGLV